MDPVTISTTLATLVGLICNYRQEKGSQEQLDHRKFIEWLEYHRHEEIKNLICETYHLQSEVDALLREDSQRLAAKLNSIEEMLARLLSRVQGFTPVVHALHPGIELSSQALEILSLFVTSDADRLVILQAPDGPKFALFPTSGGSAPTYRVPEPRFLDDDVRCLVQLGLIIQDQRDDYGGEPIYRLARPGLDYVQRVNTGRPTALRRLS
jgi:hypothetical protein